MSSVDIAERNGVFNFTSRALPGLKVCTIVLNSYCIPCFRAKPGNTACSVSHCCASIFNVTRKYILSFREVAFYVFLD